MLIEFENDLSMEAPRVLRSNSGVQRNLRTLLSTFVSLDYATELAVLTNLICPQGIQTPVTAARGNSFRPRTQDGFDDRGGPMPDRTADLLHAMQALSQLSYSPNGIAHFTDAGRHCQELQIAESL